MQKMLKEKMLKMIKVIKTITDSKGKPVLIVHKTIYYQNGEKKTIIEKKILLKNKLLNIYY